MARKVQVRRRRAAGGVQILVKKPFFQKESFTKEILYFVGTVDFSSEIAKFVNFTAEHTENAKAPENLNND